MKTLVTAVVIAVAVAGCDAGTSVNVEDSTDTNVVQEDKPQTNEEFESLLEKCEQCEDNPFDGITDAECFERFRCEEVLA